MLTSELAQYPKLHSEIGMPKIPPLESVRADDAGERLCGRRARLGAARFLPEGAHMGGDSFRAMIEEQLRRRRQSLKSGLRWRNS